MSAEAIGQPGSQDSPWQIELTGSEVARIESIGKDLVVVLAAARVSGDRRQLEPALSGGHLQGVRWHLLEATWIGEPAALIGRIDEARWCQGPSRSSQGDVRLEAPSSGDTLIELALTTALGDTLTLRAQAWRVELTQGGRFSPSLAC